MPCSETLISDPFKSTDIDAARFLVPETCGVGSNDSYRVEFQVECNFDKIKALPWGKTSHLIASEVLTLRAGQEGSPANPSYWFQLFIGQMYTDIEIIALGDDLRYNRNSIFLHEDVCEGEFMDFVIEQVIAFCQKWPI